MLRKNQLVFENTSVVIIHSVQKKEHISFTKLRLTRNGLQLYRTKIYNYNNQISNTRNKRRRQILHI